MLAANFLHAKNSPPTPQKKLQCNVRILCWKSGAPNKIWSTPGWWSLESYKHIWYSYFTQWRRAVSVLIYICLSLCIYPKLVFSFQQILLFFWPQNGFFNFFCYSSVNLANSANFLEKTPQFFQCHKFKK